MAPSATTPTHRLIAGDSGTAAAIQALLKLYAGVDARVERNGVVGWVLLFEAPKNVNLDFLRPHILKPNGGAA